MGTLPCNPRPTLRTLGLGFLQGLQTRELGEYKVSYDTTILDTTWVGLWVESKSTQASSPHLYRVHNYFQAHGNLWDEETVRDR